MLIFIITLIIGISITLLIILLIFRYRNYFNKFKLRKKKKEKEKSLDRALEKFGDEEKKDQMKEKLGTISEIITQTEAYIDQTVKKKVKAAKTQLKIKESELELIKKAKMEYSSFISNFKSAMPRTEEERKQDMKELESAISILESFDDLSYEAQPNVYDAGVGMFYDKMSRRFLSFINENKLNNYEFIPIDAIKYHAFNSIKNIKNNDILPILNAMKNTKLINDIIEINPTFHIIVFKNDEKLEFTLPEKVLLTFVYDEEILTKQKLEELTEWKQEYANKIIESLIEKEIVLFENNNIIVKNFHSAEERSAWRKVIQEKIQEVKEKEENKRKNQLERAEKLKERLAKVKDIEITEKSKTKVKKEQETEKIEFRERPTVKQLKLPKKESIVEKKKISQKIEQEIKNKDDLIGAMEALDEFMTPKIADTEEIEYEIGDDEISNFEIIIPEKILNYHEKFSLINGGLSQFEKIKSFIIGEIGFVPDDVIRTMLVQLKELKMIQDSFNIENYEFFVFNELILSDDEKALIHFAIDKEPLTKEDFMIKLEWEEERVLKTMKLLQEKNISRIEKDRIIIPGIIQKD